MLKITFKSPSIQLSYADISAGELKCLPRQEAWDQLECKASKQY